MDASRPDWVVAALAVEAAVVVTAVLVADVACLAKDPGCARADRRAVEAILLFELPLFVHDILLAFPQKIRNSYLQAV